ncbi:hypothetical protein FNH22_30400 [Fulvivirga sp. M361]|uniref:hypothetical protein n=1 Tax=Fulvivirga sp. M361 TaxID=2594266 RepID=UPI00117AD4A0|nr:hypothetical protein [Fulvivirga sp. M361]TRX47132.1 hypothetical protein FNH22_30400 [Fulvivirga sp. M361]
MKFTILYIGVFALVIFSFLSILQSESSPEVMISGEWKEVSWKYEKINSSDHLDVQPRLCNRISENAIIFCIKELKGDFEGVLNSPKWLTYR